MKKRPILSQAERFNRGNADLCPALTWKGQFTPAVHDPSVPATSDHQYWCVYTQTCIGPDNQIVEPYVCSDPKRSCHKTAVRLHR
jgi:hypothetical protein